MLICDEGEERHKENVRQKTGVVHEFRKEAAEDFLKYNILSKHYCCSKLQLEYLGFLGLEGAQRELSAR